MTEDQIDRVEQCDRDAAAVIYTHLFPLNDLRATNVRLGNIDDGYVVHAFAAHRIAAISAMPGWQGIESFTDLIRNAYIDGATDVHNAWVAGNGQTEADFGEAASDYSTTVFPPSPELKP